MAERYEVDVIANVQQYIKPLSELPGITKANAEKAALALATSLGTVEGAAAEATVKVQAFNKSLIEQGVSEKAAAAATLKYASSLTAAGTAAQTAGVSVDGAAKKTGNLGMAVGGVGQQLSDVASQLATGTNPLTILVQQGPQAATAISMAGYSLTALLPILGPVAVAVGALGAAWWKLSKDAAAAEAAQAKAAETAQKAAEAGARLNKMQADALDAEAVATGRATSKDIELRDALAAVTAEYGPRIDAARKAAAASEAEAAAALKALQTSSNSTAQLQAAYNAQQAAGAAADFHRRELAGLEQQQGALLQTTTRGILITQEKEEADKKGAKAANDHAAALRAQEAAAEAYKNALAGIVDAGEDANATALKGAEALAYARDEEIEGIRKQADTAIEAARAEQAAAEELGMGAEAAAVARQKVQDAEVAAMVTSMAVTSKYDRQREDALTKATSALSASTSEQLAGIAAVEAAYQKQQAAIVAAAEAALIFSTSDADAAAIQAASLAEVEEAKANYYDALRALDEKYTADLQKQAAEQQRIEQQAGNARIQLASTLAGAIGTIAATSGEHITDEQKQAAQVIFAIQKAAALAQIALNTILAVSQASTSAPPPYNAIPMGIAAVTGAAQFAAAAASPPPKFHAGTLSAAPGAGSARRGNEFTAVLEGGEGIIPRATMQQPGAKEQAAALVSGRSPVSSDEVAKGMDRSSLPYYLEQLVSLAKKAPGRTRNPRPGQKVRYGVA